jgi:hypothetical protein
LCIKILRFCRIYATFYDVWFMIHIWLLICMHIPLLRYIYVMVHNDVDWILDILLLLTYMHLCTYTYASTLLSLTIQLIRSIWSPWLWLRLVKTLFCLNGTCGHIWGQNLVSQLGNNAKSDQDSLEMSMGNEASLKNGRSANDCHCHKPLIHLDGLDVTCKEYYINWPFNVPKVSVAVSNRKRQFS